MYNMKKKVGDEKKWNNYQKMQNEFVYVEQTLIIMQHLMEKYIVAKVCVFLNHQ